LLAIITPFAFVYSPFIVGPFYSFCLLRYQAIYSGDVCKVKSHSKVSPDALLCIICHIVSVSYLTHSFGVTGIALWLAYMFGDGAVFVTFSQISHIPCMVEKWRPQAKNFQSWAAGQVEHSMNFAQDSTLAFYISFGLNFQVEHHLFPGISHDHYPRLAPKIEEVCKKHGVHYWTEPSLPKSMWMLF
jgi:fatty acid desaturase